MWGSSILVKLTIGLYIFVDEPVTDEHFELILGRFINTITIIFDEANAVQIGKKLFTFQSNLAHGLTVSNLTATCPDFMGATTNKQSV